MANVAEKAVRARVDAAVTNPDPAARIAGLEVEKAGYKARLEAAEDDELRETLRDRIRQVDADIKRVRGLKGSRVVPEVRAKYEGDKK